MLCNAARTQVGEFVQFILVFILIFILFKNQLNCSPCQSERLHINRIKQRIVVSQSSGFINFYMCVTKFRSPAEKYGNLLWEYLKAYKERDTLGLKPPAQDTKRIKAAEIRY